MTYQQLDIIADAYIPILLMSVVIGLFKHGRENGVIKAYENTAPFVIGVVYIYTLMLVDNKIQIWPAMSLDYSTHTALALVFVSGISLWGKRQLAIATFSMFCYSALMLYQKYHTFLDILSTSLAVLPVLLVVNYRFKRVAIS